MCQSFEWWRGIFAVRLAVYVDLARKKFVDRILLESMNVCAMVGVSWKQIVHNQPVDVFGDLRDKSLRHCVEENPVTNVVQQQLPTGSPVAFALQFARVVVVPHDTNSESFAHATMKSAPITV